MLQLMSIIKNVFYSNKSATEMYETAESAYCAKGASIGTSIKRLLVCKTDIQLMDIIREGIIL